MSESITSTAARAKPGRPRRRKRPRNADPQASTRVEILKSAAAAFRRLGYHGATVEEIAAALHMKKGNLYYYFKNKEEILFACHQYSLDRLMQILHEVRQSGLPADQQQAILGEYRAISELPGTFAGEQLQPSSTATTVRVDGGETLTTDGPFAETKEVLGGFYLYEADDLDSALEVAARIPAARMGGVVEVRPLVER